MRTGYGNGAYRYEYVPLPAEKGRLVFRLQITGTNGTAYSPLRAVDAAIPQPSSAIRLIPNPSSTRSTTVVLNNPSKGEWQIEVAALDGRRIHILRPGSKAPRIPLLATLPRGIYWVVVTELRSGQRLAEKLVVQ